MALLRRQVFIPCEPGFCRWAERQRAHVRAFTMMEVMVAGLILAVGILTAMGTVVQSNNLRVSIDENHLADLTLCQLSARLQSMRFVDLGHDSTVPNAKNWTRHLRATDAPPLNNGAIPPPIPVRKSTPLTEQELINAGILMETTGLTGMEVFVEYYNVRTDIGIIDKSGTLTRGYNGLLLYYCQQQEATKLDLTKSTRLLWHSIVGNPELGIAPTDGRANEFIMPAVFNDPSIILSEADKQKVQDAQDNGLMVRLIIAWQPRQDNLRKLTVPIKRWRESVILIRDRLDP